MNPAAAVDNVLYPLRQYPDKNRLRNDAIALINVYRDLRPAVSPPPNGPEPLFSLFGTIPVIIRAVKYNIPIRLWIPVQYPYRPPIVFVTPTAGMSVTPGHPHVAANGCVYLPYLNSWNPATHNLVPLVQAMIAVFGKQTPVYSAPAGQQPPSGAAGYGYGSPSSTHGRTASGYQPPYPGQQPAQSSYSPYSQPVQQQPPMGQTISQMGQPIGQLGQPAQGPYPSSTPAHRPPPPNPMDIKRDELRKKCREKMKEMTREDLPTKISQLEQQKREKESMLSNAMNMEEQMKKELADLTQKIKELDDFLAANSGEIDIDKITDPADVQRVQLIQTVATDMAIEDILYHFDRALLKGVIPFDDYLKLCRQYSNDQFYQRALTRRIREIFAAPAPAPGPR